MHFEIRSDRLLIDGRAGRFVQTAHSSGRIEPTLIVIHDTAGALRKFSSVEWLTKNPNKVSAHFVVETDGTVTQLADCDVKCNHAGESVWQGRRYCNGFAIGIEIVSPGKLRKSGESAVADFGHKWDVSLCEEHDSKPHGGKAYWLPYTVAQLAAVESLVAALAKAYPTIKSVAGHYEISPGRKVDPGPQFPLLRMREALINGLPEGKVFLSPETIRAAQQRLTDLGYITGSLDGVVGPRTREKLRTFQEQNGLNISGEFDPETLAAIDSETAKPMPNGARETITGDDLAKAGSKTVTNARWTKRISEGVSSILVAMAAKSASDAPAAAVPDSLSHIDSVVTKVEGARGLSERLWSILDWLATPQGLVMLGVLIVCGVAWAFAQRTEDERVTKARTGQDQGGVA